MAVDVVVVNYHTGPLLENFIASYFTHRFEGCTLTVIDVETTIEDGVAVHVADSYSAFPDNIGYGRACNIGAFTGDNDVILFANADTLLSDGFLTCYEAFMTQADWAILGPRQVNEKGQITAGGIFGPDEHLQQRAWLWPSSRDLATQIEEAPAISGSLFFIKRHVWKELTECESFQEVQPGSFGAFLETPHYYEETWCCFHARSHGYKCIYFGAVTMTHLWHRSSPVGGSADQQMPDSKKIFQAACRTHNISCES